MGFRHGDGNEKLLICANCNMPMEVDAQFCVECGVKRTQAIGVKPPIAPTVIPEVGPPDLVEPIKLKKSRDPKIRIAILGFSGKLSSGLRKRAKVVYSITSAIVAIGVYGIIQTFIFSSSSPEVFAKEYIEAVIDREESKVTLDSEFFPNPEKLPLLPQKYQKWDEVDGLSWKTNSEWNGWLGDGFVKFVPIDGNQIKEEFEFTLRIKAKYTSKFGIFRSAKWVSANSMSDVEFAFKNEENIGIQINQVPAGSSKSPELSKKRYVSFPGPLKTKLTGAGFTKDRENSILIGADGSNSINFPDIEYALNTSHVSSARTQLESSLISCLKRECSDLPRLSQFDFSFFNQPDDYLYTDYFYTDWGTSPDCSVSSFRATSADEGYVSLDCTAYASGSIKWILYRILFTTYYDTGYDSTSVSLKVSANVSRTSNPYSVKLSNIQISN